MLSRAARAPSIARHRADPPALKGSFPAPARTGSPGHELTVATDSFLAPCLVEVVAESTPNRPPAQALAEGDAHGQAVPWAIETRRALGPTLDFTSSLSCRRVTPLSLEDEST